MATELSIRRLRNLVTVVVGVGTVLMCAGGAKGQSAYELLHSFTDAPMVGSSPTGSLIRDADGNFYGTTWVGGAAGGGTIFKITPTGVLTTLHSFDCSSGGCSPRAALLQASDGHFYGTTQSGGAAGGGTIFRITADGTLTTTLHSFDCSKEGCMPGPEGGLIQASDGDFYGTTQLGGAAGGGGTVFKVTPAGVFTTLHSFAYVCTEAGGCDCTDQGCFPRAGLIQASDGDFYGTTSRSGGASFGGTVFKITATGTLTTLHSFGVEFDCTEGCEPHAGLIQASDRNVYGTTSRGGNIGPGRNSWGDGTIFKITAGGDLTTLHTFICSDSGCSPDRGEPSASAPLIQASDGNFYGMTSDGAAVGNGGGLGTAFKITPAGTFTTLHSFSLNVDPNEGCFPRAALIQASDGSLYGTTPSCGPGGGGVVFRLVGRLSALSPASVWIGLRNSDDVGLRLDLLAEVFVGGTMVGEGRLDNVSAGGSGFNNAVLRAIPLVLTGGRVDFSVVAPLELKLSVRRACSGRGHASGTARLWYNSLPADSGARRDAGSRFDAISDGATTSHFLRSRFALSTVYGRASRQSIDVSLDAKQPCPGRPFKPFGIWSNSR